MRLHKIPKLHERIAEQQHSLQLFQILQYHGVRKIGQVLTWKALSFIDVQKVQIIAVEKWSHCLSLVRSITKVLNDKLLTEKANSLIL